MLSQVLGSEASTDGSPGANPQETSSASPRTGPLALVPVEAPTAGSPECNRLTAALPDELPGADLPLRRLPIADPAPKATAAWSADRGEPLVLRCGLGRPPELTPTASLLQIDKVRWLTVRGDAAETWFVVDRAVYIALTVPAGTGTGPLQKLSATVDDTLAAAPVRTR
ncbi:DUF3515 domain-containing protein [Actinophytocola sediminis]